ncbi:hypothetical protein SAMN05660649_04302 [Desulfotomaculum arcticum]|uniref:Uncharacterized protein n=1 Tax=Desulfotruncus arcticus DSM 17038 TaxID=1121424 RepID=A0A1I2Y8F1_9FIRM|nr:hypothetical protein [Desulfotruncus arcticus]SFH21902.1 hypothetical protein SAMN05660649_04302 [Desulfotomaculum arcticum] [Desulfotruncus arcticus DSM 17038]
MFLLADSIRKTANILDGWQVGNLVIEDGVFIQLDSGDLMPVAPGAILEVCNDGQWQRLSESDIEVKTIDGWPAYAGMDARFFVGGLAI